MRERQKHFGLLHRKLLFLSYSELKPRKEKKLPEHIIQILAGTLGEEELLSFNH